MAKRRTADARGRAAVRASTDGFHHPAAERYRRGRSSPEGFYYDSYDLDRLRSDMLDPCSPHGHGVFRDAVFDVTPTGRCSGPQRRRPQDAVVLVDRLLHRPELRPYWHYSVLLRVRFEVSIPRGAARRPGFGSPDPSAPSNRRYVEGQRLYFRDAEPERHASLVIDNNDLCRPAIVATR